MADPNQPVAQILKTPRNKHSPQNIRNIHCPNFFLSFNSSPNPPKSTLKDEIFLLRCTLWATLLTWAGLKDSGPSPETGVSDLGELSWRSMISWLWLLLLLLPLWVFCEELLLVLLLLLLFRLKECALRVIGPENLGLLTRCDKLPPSSVAVAWWWWWLLWWCPISSHVHHISMGNKRIKCANCARLCVYVRENLRWL